MAELVTNLNEQLIASLQSQKLVLLATIDSESGCPTQHAISWILATTPTTLRFAVDSRSRIVTNLRKQADVVISLFADQSIFSVDGTAYIHESLLADVPLKLTCIDVSVRSVRDIMYYGSRIAAEPVCEKTYDQRAADKLDDQVFTAMKKA